MNWNELVKNEIEEAYRATDGLMAQAEGLPLDWKPATGSNWMTTGQLLEHIGTTCCGSCIKGFATGDWGMTGGTNVGEMPLEEMLPPAEKLPTVGSVKEAREKLARDKKIALEIIEDVERAGRWEEPSTAPWDPRPAPLGKRMLSMVAHLQTHKAQLFYYLKLQGKPVNTMTLYGMA